MNTVDFTDPRSSLVQTATHLLAKYAHLYAVTGKDLCKDPKKTLMGCAMDKRDVSQIFRLRYDHGKGVPEIAAVIGRTPEAVAHVLKRRSRISREHPVHPKEPSQFAEMAQGNRPLAASAGS